MLRDVNTRQHLRPPVQFGTRIHPGNLHFTEYRVVDAVELKPYARRYLPYSAMKCMKQGEKSKRESSPWVKRKKKPRPKKKNDSNEEAKKMRLAASDKGSWYNQSELLSTSLNACETGKEIGTSSSKIHSSR